MKAIRHYFTGINKMIYPLAVLVFLVVVDGWLTNVLVNSGAVREGNPLLVHLVGGGDFLFLKLAGASLCAFILWDIYRHRPKMVEIGTSCLVAVYAGIVLWNLFLLLATQL